MDDWCYRYDGSLEVTVEISNPKWPSASLLPALWAQNRESMQAFAQAAMRGVRGIVSDARGGLPVRAIVRVEGFHQLVFTTPEVGDYHRLLRPGNYTPRCYAPGYIPRCFTNVAVGGGEATRLDIALQPVSSRFAINVVFWGCP